MSETERLIEFVRERPFLYDMSDPDYKNRAKRLETWREIAHEMGAGNADIWSSKWKGLKDNFAKFKKSTEPEFAETYKKYKNWPWSEHVRFLDDHNCSSGRRISSNTARARREAQDSLHSTGIVEMYLRDDMINLESTDQSNDPEQDRKHNKKRKIYNTEATDDEQDNHKIKKNDNPTLDGVDHFFLSYAQSFKKLPSRMQIMLKLEIATLFSRYELQADGVTKESIANISRIVPHPVKCEFDFTNITDD